MPRRYFFLFLATLLSAATARGDNNWPEFRGPQGDGHAGNPGLPLTWGEREHVRWKTPIHDKGWSSPVVWDKQIWLTTAPADGTSNYALCIDLASGRVLRDIKLWDIAEPRFCHPYNSYASCTPAIEAGRVYVHFGSQGTAAIDTKTGKTLWRRRNLECNHFRGPGSSPILWRNLLILTFDGFDFQYVIALNKATGDTVWRTDRDVEYGTTDGDAKKSYSTPRVIDFAGRLQLISPSAGAMVAYEPSSGRELWRVRSMGMNAAARPLFGGGLVYTTTAAGGFQLFATRPDGEGDVTDTHVSWKQGKNVPSRSSPLLVGERIYMINDGGVASAVAALTGKQLWQHRLEGKYSASPLFADGRIYFFSEEGASPVIAPEEKFHQLAINFLDDGCMASPAVAGKALIVRTKTHLYRLEE